VFFWVGTKNRKRILLGAVAAIIVAATAIWLSGWLFEWNTGRLYNQPSLQSAQEQNAIITEAEQIVTSSATEIIISEEAPLADTTQWKPEGNGNSGQGTFMGDLPTLNGRAAIWTAFLQKIWNEPAILLRGTVDSRLVMVNLHTHNAWLEALIMLGLPGFLLVLVFSWNATWASLRVLWHGSIGMFEKNIALLVLSMMVSALLEPCLFITYQEWSFFDFFFFLSLGYLTLWSKQLRRKNET
jgi:hypothetical protein